MDSLEHHTRLWVTLPFGGPTTRGLGPARPYAVACYSALPNPSATPNYSAIPG